jgi:hypothetical protein
MPNYCLRWNEDAIRDGFSALVDGSWGFFLSAGLLGFASQKKERDIETQTGFPAPFRVPQDNDPGEEKSELKADESK